VNLEQLFSPFSPPITNLVDSLRYWTEHQPDQPAFYFSDGEGGELCYSYSDLDRRARAIGAYLVDQGMRGERVLLLYPPGLDFVAGFFGCLYAGATAIPAYPPRRNRYMARIEAISEDARAKAALTIRDVADRARGMLKEAPSLQRAVWTATDQISDEWADSWTDPQLTTDHLALLQYTSGSTGTPKGVMLSHGNIVHNTSIITQSFESGRNAVGLSWLPTYHDMGLVGGVLKPLFYGRPTVLMSPMTFLQKPVRWLRAITKYGATISGGPNFAYDLCTDKITDKQLDGLDLGTWEVAFNGAEPIRPSTLEAFSERFRSVGFRPENFFPCYGMAETTLIVTGSCKSDAPIIRSFDGEALDEHRVVAADPEELNSRRLVGCGHVLPDEEVLIVDPESCKRLPDHQVGEVWVRSGSVGKGYWNNPTATKEIFQARLAGRGQEQYLRTGDLGFMDGSELFVTGRLKDLIIVHGVNRYPQDIELTVERSDARLQAGASAAFSVDLNGRECLIVIGEVERTRTKEWSEVLQAIRRNVTREHELSPDGILLVRFSSMPKTSSGKIQRHACRDAFLKNSLQIIAQWFAWSAAEDDGPPLSGGEQPAMTDRLLTDQPHSAEAVIDYVREAVQERAKTVDANIDGDTVATSIIDRHEMVSFSSTNYLGMSGDPAVSRAAKDAIDRFGTGVSAGRPVSGEKPIYRQLEEQIASWIGTQDAVVFAGGHSTIETTIGDLFGQGNLILHDGLALNRIMQRATLAGAQCRVFAHNDWQHLDSILREVRHEYRRVLITIEGVDRMEGDFPDVPQFLTVKQRHQGFLVVDEAHSIGTMGASGRGLVEHFEIDPGAVDLWTGTLSNSLGSCGDYFAGCAELVEYLKFTATGFVDSAGLAPANAAAALAALRLLEAEPERVAKVQANSQLFLRLARENGLNTGLSNQTPIVPVFTGSSSQTLQLSQFLNEQGISVQLTLSPAVEEQAGRLRFFITSAHSEEQVRFAVEKTALGLQRIKSGTRQASAVASI
jgi:acyl-CoA synthetase (AMP-forming)/AMP-acid ligase II/7-keto-8-aminopelargonate synthetase-like enzyme